MSLSTHCIGHITTGSFMGRGNQYIQLVKVLRCKLPTNYQVSHLRSGWDSNSDLRGGRRECYHSATVAPYILCKSYFVNQSYLAIILIAYWGVFTPVIDWCAVRNISFFLSLFSLSLSPVVTTVFN